MDKLNKLLEYMKHRKKVTRERANILTKKYYCAGDCDVTESDISFVHGQVYILETLIERIMEMATK